MRQRNVTKEDVYHAIDKPDEVGLPTGPGRQHVRFYKTARIGIDVIYELIPTADTVRIITTYKYDRQSEEGVAPKIFRMNRQKSKRRGRKR